MVLFSSSTLNGDELILENFDKGSENRWNFFSDQVMGGISTGKLYFQKEGELNFINLVGDVLGSGPLKDPINLTFKANPIFTGTGSMTIPVGTTAQRPNNPVLGMTRINTDL